MFGALTVAAYMYIKKIGNCARNQCAYSNHPQVDDDAVTELMEKLQNNPFI